MTPTESLARELRKVAYKDNEYITSWFDVSKHVQKLILDARIEALNSCITPIHPDGYMMPIMIDQRIAELKKQLTEENI